MIAFEAVSFQPDVWKAIVGGVLQRPDFNSKGAALAFGDAVHRGARNPEPVDCMIEKVSKTSQRVISNGRIFIRHRVTAPEILPELYSAWEVWGDFEDSDTARKAHDWALANGPWNNPFITDGGKPRSHRKKEYHVHEGRL